MPHEFGNFFVTHAIPFNERLLDYNLEISFCITPKAKYSKCCFWEIGIVQRYAVKCQYWFNEIIQSYSLYQCGTMIIYYRFSTFSYSFTEGISKRLIDIVNPYAYSFCPFFYS